MKNNIIIIFVTVLSIILYITRIYNYFSKVSILSHSLYIESRFLGFYIFLLALYNITRMKNVDNLFTYLTKEKIYFVY